MEIKSLLNEKGHTYIICFVTLKKAKAALKKGGVLFKHTTSYRIFYFLFICFSFRVLRVTSELMYW